MIEQLKTFLENLKNNPRVANFDEAATKQAIILPILHALGWNTYNIDEVSPEFSVEGGRIDYSLQDNNINKVFIEVKKTGEDLEKHEEQLLFYSFRQGVKLASLTNGMTWWFYLPTEEAEWKSRKFYTIDISQQESADVASRFVDLLSKTNVISGKASQNAESIYRGRIKKKAITENLPEAWNKILLEPDGLLVDLLAETTEKLCGFKPDNKQVETFLKENEEQLLLLPKDDSIAVPPLQERIPRQRIYETTNQNTIHIGQDDLIPYIVKVLQRHGGRATKKQVENEIYEIFKDRFNEPWYQDTVSHGVPRWKHNIAFAKERAKLLHHYVKSAEESGRGYWELTETGKRITID